MMTYCLAVDIGASSGRHIVGWEENGEIKTDEVYRFPNGMKEYDGHLIWDTNSLFSQVKKGIDEAKKSYDLSSISIDTWGVDYVLMNGDEEISPTFAYRDNRTEEIIEEVHSIVSFEELYERTGIQFQTFNSIYQIYADKKAGRLDDATDLLMMPEYLIYRLSGQKHREFTNATTTGLINKDTLDFDRDVINRLGLPQRLFPRPEMPGTAAGKYDGTDVILCATHDTGSAVEGIPMQEDEIYISSGTWSLLGVRTGRPLTDSDSMAENWSNEGGIGYNRYQKNIMGMWLVNELRRELCPDRGFPEIVEGAKNSSFNSIIDASDVSLTAPSSMKEAFDALLAEKPEDAGGYFRCAYRSLAACYETAVRELEENTGRRYGSICIVGGGANNVFLNELTEEMTGKHVIALPIEATALGNLKVQLRALKDNLFDIP